MLSELIQLLDREFICCTGVVGTSKNTSGMNIRLELHEDEGYVIISPVTFNSHSHYSHAGMCNYTCIIVTLP